jgi:putative Holliday junction resolvase
MARDRRPGVWLGVDVGTVRVGVARGDATGLLAFPLVTLKRDRKRGSDLDQLMELVAEYDAVGVVVGMPTTLAGRQGASADMARRYGDELALRIAPVPVRFVDERLSTVTAMRILRDQGMRGPAGRAVVDQLAAVQILQLFLDGEPDPS